MKLKPKTTIAEHFGQIDDPRVERSKQHELIDIITIAICAVICGKEFGDKKLSQPSHPDPSTQVKWLPKHG